MVDLVQNEPDLQDGAASDFHAGDARDPPANAGTRCWKRGTHPDSNVSEWVTNQYTDQRS